jgi:hypothetical protein
MADPAQAQERRKRTLVLNDRIGRGSTDCGVGIVMCARSATSAQRNARIVLKDIAFIPKDEITQAIALLIVTLL